jgi:hypothetical protein
MALRGRVGRHASTGRQCQNWREDQQEVIALLNKIPIADGGAEGTLKPPVVAGYAADALYTSILYFQKKQFPAAQSGYVDPGGPVLAKLQSLASRPPPPPPKPGQWDNIKSGSVDKALRAALADDLKIDHEETVEIIRATLSNGIVSTDELADLTTIADTSRSLAPRSKALLKDFVFYVNYTTGGKGPYRLPLEKHQFAANMVCDFLKRSGKTYFPKLSRDTVGLGLLMRIANPGLLRQGAASLCGPAALLHNIATDSPGGYARYAIDLFENGRASLGRLYIKPGSDVRSYQPEGVTEVDWLTMASLRDSENWFFDYDTAKGEFSGITLPGELADWFRKAGYSDVTEDTNLTNLTHKGAGTVEDANELYDKGYRVCLFISANMMEEADQSWRGSVFTRHWIVQRSRIDLSNGKAKVTVFSWGQGDYQIPHGKKELSDDEFLGNFYGYVAART